MHPRKLPNGHLLIPARDEGADGMVGHGMIEIDDTHPHWAVWMADYELSVEVESGASRNQKVPWSE